jgi:hypothetical protein
MHGNNAGNLPVWIFSSQTSKNAKFFLLSYLFFSSTKWENKRVEQVLPRGRMTGGGGRELAQIMYTCVRKYKNHKIKVKKRIS